MGRAHGAARRVLAVWCPDWPLGTPESGPEARSLEPEARAFEQVVAAVEEFCPRVEVVRPGTCAIGAAGPARYFGGEESLVRKITDAVTALGFACRAGLADSLFAAQLAARVPAGAGRVPAGAAVRAAAAARVPSGAAVGAAAVRAAARTAGRVPAGPAAQAPGRVALPGLIVPPGGTRAFLAPYPVSLLDIPEFADLLPRLGIWTLGDFAGLSAAEAANRFGTPGRRAHRLARGLDARPLTPRRPSADLSVHIDFDPPADQAEPVVFAAKALAERMHAGLAARGLACVRVQAQAIYEDGQDITRLWRHDGMLSALAVAQRVRWQLDSWRTGQDVPSGGQEPGSRKLGGQVPDETVMVGGITRLRLVPDQLVRDEGSQLGLWGDAVISDRVARVATRVQAMLGHEAVMRPVLAGGRDPAEQVTLVPFGDSRTPNLPAGCPWPGRIPAPSPVTVYPVPLPAQVTDDSGSAVTVTGRAVVSAPPARLSAGDGPWLAVTAWAGPWPVTERWWAAESTRRRARFQLVTEDGNAWLAAVQDGQWLIDASYD